MNALSLIIALSLVTVSPALAQAAGGMAGMSMDAAPAAKLGEGVGEVKAVDTKAGRITLHHAPVAALGWPAMTMTFRIDPQLLQGIKPGQKVKFTVKDGEAPEVVALAPL
jgi:Cu(I)/Ag(I) efflux system protein CusF